MTCIVIRDWDNRFLSVAENYESAIDFLIKGWLTAYDKVSVNYDEVQHNYPTIEEFFGDDWEQKLSALGLEKFNETFLDDFCLEEIEIYSKTS